MATLIGFIHRQPERQWVAFSLSFACMPLQHVIEPLDTANNFDKASACSATSTTPFFGVRNYPLENIVSYLIGSPCYFPDYYPFLAC